MLKKKVSSKQREQRQRSSQLEKHQHKKSKRSVKTEMVKNNMDGLQMIYEKNTLHIDIRRTNSLG